MKQGKRNSTDLQGFCVSLTGLKNSIPTLKLAYLANNRIPLKRQIYKTCLILENNQLIAMYVKVPLQNVVCSRRHSILFGLLQT